MFVFWVLFCIFSCVLKSTIPYRNLYFLEILWLECERFVTVEPKPCGLFLYFWSFIFSVVKGSSGTDIIITFGTAPFPKIRSDFQEMMMLGSQWSIGGNWKSQASWSNGSLRGHWKTIGRQNQKDVQNSNKLNRYYWMRNNMAAFFNLVFTFFCRKSLSSSTTIAEWRILGEGTYV